MNHNIIRENRVIIEVLLPEIYDITKKLDIRIYIIEYTGRDQVIAVLGGGLTSLLLYTL